MTSPPLDAPAAPQAPLDPSVRVLRQFRQLFNAVRSHFRQVERHAGIGGAQLWALSLVKAQPGLGVGALAQAMDVHQTTASNLVKSLVAAELIAVRRSESDRRAVQLALLPAGAALLEQAPGPFSGVLPAALAQLQPEQILRLERDLTDLLRLIETESEAAGIPLAEL